MKIGIMLRHMDQHGGGVMVYTNNLLSRLLRLKSPHEYVLIYRNSDHLGTYAALENVTEVVVRAPSVFLWDQVACRQVEKRHSLDLIFNPKYSVPLTARCPTVFVCHGLDWYVMPWGSRWMDRFNHRLLFPRYGRKASRIIAVSETTRGHVIEHLALPEERVRTIYLGVDEHFFAPIPPDKLAEVQRRYKLPERFFLYCGQIYPPKNFGRLVEAFAAVGPALGISLVVAGTHTWLCEDEIRSIGRLGLEKWVVQPGWIDRQTLPVFYRLAEALVMPSLYEACPSPILEAMATGTPVVTANRYGTAELAADAAELVDPEDVASIAAGMRRVAEDENRSRQLVAAGEQRIKDFNWAACARQTLAVLEEAVT